MSKKLDDEAAFQFYVTLGDARSHGAVSRHFKVSRRAVGKASRRGNWVARLEKIERESREKSDAKLTETLSEVRDRHLKMLRVIASRGVQALQANQLDDAMQGVKAIVEAVKLERTILGEPSERVGISMQEITRREIETLLAPEDEPADGPDDY